MYKQLQCTQCGSSQLGVHSHTVVDVGGGFLLSGEWSGIRVWNWRTGDGKKVVYVCVTGAGEI